MAKTSNLLQNEFDLISIQFAVHYFFENEETITNLIDNIDQKLKMNGYLIGSCFDGNKIFNKFETKKINQLSTSLWKIQKLYNQTKPLTEDIESEYQPYKINVYVDSIGQNIEEYLVNFNYLIKLLEERNIKLISLEDFDSFQHLQYNHKLTNEEKQFSLNSYFVFSKNRIYM